METKGKQPKRQNNLKRYFVSNRLSVAVQSEDTSIVSSITKDGNGVKKTMTNTEHSAVNLISVDDAGGGKNVKSDKKRKLKKSLQKYRPEWEKTLSWLTSSSSDIHAGYCKICLLDVKCAAGIVDLQKHAATQKHQQRAVIIRSDCEKTQRKLDCFTDTDLQNQVRESELKLCAWGVSNNQSALQVEKITAMIKLICPDSKIANRMRMGRTKATKIVVNVLGEGQHEDLSKYLEQTHFSLMADESTDISCKKSLALVVRTYFWKGTDLKICDCFYDLIEVVETDANTLYNKVIDCFRRDGIPYQKSLIGYAADGANNMTGSEKSLGALLKKDCPSLFQLKCICHSFALCSSYACKHLPQWLEQLCKDIYNYLSNSPMRVSKFEEIQALLELKPLKILHPSATRWLSLEAVVKRILERYEALLIYFGFVVNIDHSDSLKAKTIQEGLMRPTTKMYLCFLSYVLGLVNKLNLLFQSESPELPVLHSVVSRLFKTILENFVKEDHINSVADLSHIVFKPENYVELDDLYIGTAAEAALQEGRRNNNLSNNDCIAFKCNIIQFYVTLAHQVLKRINFTDQTFANLSAIEPKNVMERKQRSILPLLESFPHLVGLENFQQADDEFREIKNLDFDSLDTSCSVQFWQKILNMQRGDGYAFPILRKFIPCLLILPHSSAAVERLFSEHNNNKTKIRNRLSIDTMRGILATKSLLKQDPEEYLTKTVKVKYNYNMYNKEC